jgi:zinc D-Ala-D-Ala carboxypeptidase
LRIKRNTIPFWPSCITCRQALIYFSCALIGGGLIVPNIIRAQPNQHQVPLPAKGATKAPKNIPTSPSRYYQGPIKNITPTKEELLGQIRPWDHPEQFVKVPRKYANNHYHYTRTDVWNAYREMLAAAHKSGIHLEIVSSFRRWHHQAVIWEAKWTGKKKVLGYNLSTDITSNWQKADLILRFSAMPGTSRHHWGTELDFNRTYNPYFEKDYGAKVYNWLKENAPKYGFCQPYTEKSPHRPEGVWEEKWHWSYAPISIPFAQAYKKLITYHDIKGFKGAYLAKEFNVIEKYVEGIDPSCQVAE